MLPLLALATMQSPGFAKDRAKLTAGITGNLSAPGATCGPILVDGPNAFAFITAKSNGVLAPLMGGAYIGEGRAIAAGHESFFSSTSLANPNNARLLENSLSWLAGKRLSGVRVGVIDMGDIPAYLQGKVKTVTTINAQSDLGKFDVVCMTQDAFHGDVTAATKFSDFVKSGKGILIAGPAWGWLQLNPGKSLADNHSGNLILRSDNDGFAPLQFVDGYLDEPYSKEGGAEPLLEFDAAIAYILDEGNDPAKVAIATTTIERAAGFPVCKDIRNKLNHLTDGVVVNPTKEHPVTLQMTKERIAARLQANGFSKTKTKHIAADYFPGVVAPSAPRVTQTITVPAHQPDWAPTALYAPPGELVKVTTSIAGLRLRVDAHTDTLWGSDSWVRFPEVSISYPLSPGVTRITSPFGGTIYVDAGAGLGAPTNLTISGAVVAPRYVLNQTTASQWQASIGSAAVPWTDLEGTKVAITVPTAAAATVSDPKPLMQYWDEVMTNAYALYGEPVRPRKERYCVDYQISAGYMHSGYPIMTFDDVAYDFVNVDKLRIHGQPIASWGFYHEMGHNFQQAAWTFDGTGEVTNNIFSLYAAEKLNGVTPQTYGLAHPAMEPTVQRDRLVAYLNAGANYEQWKADPFLALTMYAQLRKGFGWQPFRDVFAEYRTLSAGELPQTDQDKRDQWMVRFSRHIGKNLGPFFQAWGVPTTQAARDSIASLPTWMPADWP